MGSKARSPSECACDGPCSRSGSEARPPRAGHRPGSGQGHALAFGKRWEHASIRPRAQLGRLDCHRKCRTAHRPPATSFAVGGLAARLFLLLPGTDQLNGSDSGQGRAAVGRPAPGPRPHQASTSPFCTPKWPLCQTRRQGCTWLWVSHFPATLGLGPGQRVSYGKARWTLGLFLKVDRGAAVAQIRPNLHWSLGALPSRPPPASCGHNVSQAGPSPKPPEGRARP